MRHFIWKIFLTEVFLVLFFITVYVTNGYAQIPPFSDPGGPYSAYVGESILFDGSGSFDLDGVIIQYIWDFGDGDTDISAIPNINHVYASQGNYTVTLLVVDNDGLQGVDTTNATISDLINQPPVVDPNGPYTGIVGQPVQFDGSGTFDPDGDPLLYLWEFGDGSIPPFARSEPTITYAYSAGGNYTVTLTVTDAINTPVNAQTTAAISEVSQSQDFCKGNFDYDKDVDGTDAAVFKDHFGRSAFKNPCPPDGPAPVEKTWQIPSYATGDDGYYQKGVPWATDGSRWTDNGDGTVTDHLTGLIWLKNANCFGQKQWYQALLDCNGLANGSCGLTDGSNPGDWRLPNVKELQSHVDYDVYNPAIWSTHPYNNVQSFYYWSSTTNAYMTNGAWYMNMDDGTVNSSYRSINGYVWPVRGGR